LHLCGRITSAGNGTLDSANLHFLADWTKSITLNVGINDVTTSGWIGLGAIGVVAGIVAGVSEALGKSWRQAIDSNALITRLAFVDLSLNDNLTLPIISGASLYGFFKVPGLCFS
jgi:diacylglycerol kinase (CTP)